MPALGAVEVQSRSPDPTRAGRSYKLGRSRGGQYVALLSGDPPSWQVFAGEFSASFCSRERRSIVSISWLKCASFHASTVSARPRVSVFVPEPKTAAWNAITSCTKTSEQQASRLGDWTGAVTYLVQSGIIHTALPLQSRTSGVGGERLKPRQTRTASRWHLTS